MRGKGEKQRVYNALRASDAHEARIAHAIDRDNG